MQFLVLGKGKTGSLVAEVARERGHAVRALDVDENLHASRPHRAAISPASTRSSTSPPRRPPWKTCAPCSLSAARIVVGTTGWYEHLNEMKSLAQQYGGGLLYGTNFSIGVQKLFRLTAQLAQLDGYSFTIDETHHVSKLDAPSGTAITLREIIQAARPKAGPEVFIASHRVGDAKGEHIVKAVSESDTLEIRHEIKDRRCLALGAVRGAEWLANNSGPHDFRDIFDRL